MGGFKYNPSTAYASLTINNNATGFSVTAAADSSLNTNTDYKVVSGTGAPWTPDLVFEMGVSSDSISAPFDGIYNIQTWLDIVSFPSNVAKLALKYIVNGNQYSLRKVSVKSNSAGDYGNITGFGLVQLSEGDEIKLAVASTVTGAIVFESGNLTLSLVRAL